MMLGMGEGLLELGWSGEASERGQWSRNPDEVRELLLRSFRENIYISGCPEIGGGCV